MSEKKTERPTPKWAHWALVQAATKEGQYWEDALILCRDRLQELTDPRVSVMFVVMSESGHWGRGPTMPAAADACIFAGARKNDMVVLYVVLNDRQPIVNQLGSIEANASSMVLALGRVRRLGALVIG